MSRIKASGPTAQDMMNLLSDLSSELAVAILIETVEGLLGFIEYRVGNVHRNLPRS